MVKCTANALIIFSLKLSFQLLPYIRGISVTSKQYSLFRESLSECSLFVHQKFSHFQKEGSFRDRKLIKLCTKPNQDDEKWVKMTFGCTAGDL
jgi:hypothetical protein